MAISNFQFTELIQWKRPFCQRSGRTSGEFFFAEECYSLGAFLPDALGLQADEHLTSHDQSKPIKTRTRFSGEV